MEGLGQGRMTMSDTPGKEKEICRKDFAWELYAEKVIGGLTGLYPLLPGFGNRLVSKMVGLLRLYGIFIFECYLPG